MSKFTLVISCLTTFNLPWFMDLTFQVPMQYCSLHHWTLFLSPVTSTPVTITTRCCFCFGSIPSFFLELFLHWSPVAYWAPTDLGSSSFSIISFCLFILFMGFSRQEYWSGLPFPSPVDHILSDLIQNGWLVNYILKITVLFFDIYPTVPDILVILSITHSSLIISVSITVLCITRFHRLLQGLLSCWITNGKISHHRQYLPIQQAKQENGAQTQNPLVLLNQGKLFIVFCPEGPTGHEIPI